jgi:hypothetical protein
MMLLYFSCLSSWGSRLPVTAVTIFSEPGGVMERKRFQPPWPLRSGLGKLATDQEALLEYYKII